jgi:hypothetical protein
MAKASIEIIEVLRKTASILEKSDRYQWGHMGSCNCGFLAQQITSLRKEQIHTRAMERYGDWSEQLNDYCPASGLAFDELISDMLAFGFDSEDLKHLEKLSDGQILRSLPLLDRNLKHNLKEDVIKYLVAWAAQLEERLIDTIKLPSFAKRETVCE